MKLILACLLLVAAAQAAKLSNTKSHFSTRHESRPLNSRIVEGFEADRHQFPYQVGIYKDSDTFCGGSLISDTVVLTAAQCVVGFRTFDVHLAAHNILNFEEQDRQIVRSTNTIVHENYDPSTYSNDLAIIILDEAVSGTGIGVVRIPSRSMVDDYFYNFNGRFAGWGSIAENDPNLTSVLRWNNFTIISDYECSEAHGSLYDLIFQICINTEFVIGTTSPCNGDEGGPLTIYEIDGVPTQLGVLSFGFFEGCEDKKPAVFMRLTKYLDWLETNAGITIRP